MKFGNSSSDESQTAERWSGRTLQFGVWVSASFMVAGLVAAAVWPSPFIVSSMNPSLRDLAVRLLSGSFDPATLMFSGLVILMMTPVLRVITAVLGFGMERDWRFVLVSSIVLLLLGGEIVYSVLVKG